MLSTISFVFCVVFGVCVFLVVGCVYRVYCELHLWFMGGVVGNHFVFKDVECILVLFFGLLSLKSTRHCDCRGFN